MKAGHDNNVSEGRAIYLLRELTKCDYKRDLHTILSSTQGQRSGKVTSYIELVNWLFRKYADDPSLSVKDAVFHGERNKTQK